MEISQLRALIALQELASLARAGEQLHLSPSAVFCQIRQLEDETGLKLYERVGKKLHLTGSGEVLAQHARKILDAHNTALAEVQQRSASRKELLRLGCGPHSSIRIAPFLLSAFLEAEPHAEVRLTSSDDQTLLREVRSGLLDAILMTLPIQDKDLAEEPLWSYEMVFVLPPGSILVKRGAKLADLKNLPFILYRRAVAIDAALRSLCADLGFTPNVVMENDEVDSIKELVKLGLGITVLPLWSVGEESRKGSLRVLRPVRQHVQNYGLLYRKSEYRPQVLTRLREVAHRWSEWWPHASQVAGPLGGTMAPD